MQMKHILLHVSKPFQTKPSIYFVFQIVGILFAATIILSIALTQIVTCLLIVLATIVCVYEGKYYRTPFDLPLLLFVLARIISILLSEVRDVSLVSLYREVPFYFVFFALTQLFYRSTHQYQRLFIFALILSGAIGAVYGSVLFSIGSIDRAHSTTSGYYTLGTYLTALFAYMLIVGNKSAGWRKSIGWVLGVLLYFTGIVLTLNRIHWGITVFLLLVVALLKYRKLLIVLLVGWILLYFSSPLVQQRVEQTLHFTSHLSDRDILWQEGLRHVLVHPYFGYGPNTFHYIFEGKDKLQDKKVSGWHNEYLRLQIESGVFGIVAFLILIGTVLVHSIYTIRESTTEKRQHIIGLDFSLLTITLSSITGSAFFDILILLLWVSLCAILFTASRDTTKETELL